MANPKKVMANRAKSLDKLHKMEAKAEGEATHVQTGDDFAGYKPYNNVDGTMVPSPVLYPGDAEGTAAIKRYEQ